MWAMACNPKDIFFTTEDTESTKNNKKMICFTVSSIIIFLLFTAEFQCEGADY